MVELVEPKKRIEGDPELIAMVLDPYKPNCRYLKRASLTFSDPKPSSGPSGERQTWPLDITADGEFSIPEPCYIDATGHFNAVEFNICYNQLTYYAIAHAVKQRVMAPLSDWDLDVFKRRRLPDILIAGLSSNFRQQMHSDAFRGNLRFSNALQKKRAMIIDTDIRFGNGGEWMSDGKVLLAIVDSSKLRPSV